MAGSYIESDHIRSGETGDRPSGVRVGTEYFDTTLGYTIWWDGTNWVDSAGTTV
jgi:hypothetical protein